MKASRVKSNPRRIEVKPISAGKEIQKAPVLLTVEEMAAQLRIGRNSAYNLVKAGEIRSIKIGRTIRIPQSAVTEFVGGNS